MINYSLRNEGSKSSGKKYTLNAASYNALYGKTNNTVQVDAIQNLIIIKF